MKTIALVKIACALSVLTVLIGTIWVSMQRDTQPVRPSTPAEKKIVAQRMTGWGDSFAKHK